MKPKFKTLFLNCILLSLLFTGCKEELSPPNILWLMTDEHRADALGYTGTPWAHTPNLDQLAEEGVAFLNAYTQAPVCTPARVSILTGKYCSESGVWRNIGEHSLEFDLLTDIFREAGYRSATFGKQHYGGPERAFDKEESLVISEYVDCYGYHERYDESKYDVVKYPNAWVLGGRFPEPAEKSREAECVRGAMKWLEEGPQDQPFLLRLSFSAPHTPVVPPVPFDTMIKEEDIRMPAEADPLPPGHPVWMGQMHAFSQEEIMKMRRYYFGYVAFVDDQFGQLLDWMEEKGYMENTIIAFVSDHGTHLSDNGRVQKGTFYDPSAKVCYQFWYPGTVAEGVLLETPVETRSLLPTFLDLAGLELPEDLANLSLADNLIRGSEPEARPVFSEMSFGFDPRHPDNRVVMVRDGDWKLSWCPDVPTEKGELINLKQDPYEQNNLYGQPEFKVVQNEMLSLIHAHLEGTDRPFRNVRVLDELMLDGESRVQCASCRRVHRTKRLTGLENAPDWTDGLEDAYRCGHCGTRFGIKK